MNSILDKRSYFTVNSFFNKTKIKNDDLIIMHVNDASKKRGLFLNVRNKNRSQNRRGNLIRQYLN